LESTGGLSTAGARPDPSAARGSAHDLGEEIFLGFFVFRNFLGEDVDEPTTLFDFPSRYNLADLNQLLAETRVTLLQALNQAGELRSKFLDRREMDLVLDLKMRFERIPEPDEARVRCMA